MKRRINGTGCDKNFIDLRTGNLEMISHSGHIPLWACLSNSCVVEMSNLVNKCFVVLFHPIISPFLLLYSAGNKKFLQVNYITFTPLCQDVISFFQLSYICAQ